MFELASNAVVTGLLLGGIYAVASLGLTIAFGLLQVPNVAHPTFVVLGAYCAYFGNLVGLDPVLAGVLFAPAFYVAGMLFYEAYFICFERRGRGDTLQSFTFFFGVALVLEVALILAVGVDLRSVDARYIGKSLTLGVVTMPYRLACGFSSPGPIPASRSARSPMTTGRCESLRSTLPASSGTPSGSQ
jgi:branched-chain amino acid transport system permease protein